MAKCLTPAEIEELLSDKLSPAARTRAENHLGLCAQCRALRDQVQTDEKLFGRLQQADQATDSTETDTDQTVSTPERRSSSSPISLRITGYEILAEIHSGGQGIVYKAIQKATKRTVALKVLLDRTFASKKHIERFHREVDLLASVDHPNIVTIYDSGISQDRGHYFAMEYIHGLPLDHYVRDADMDVRDILILFQTVCSAIGHAHMRGIIHRDLKPNNVLVSAQGKPHVLDFGLAKAAGTQLLDGGHPMTMTGEFMGTLAYAAPEQTKGDPNLIDVRTDVYSLGVMLYELLTSKRPYSVDGRIDEAVKVINESQPQNPSALNSRINHEVETIILKAMAKEPERRYLSAAALADDIGRYLNGEAIDAKRASSMYMLKKAVGRYRQKLMIGSLVAIVIVFTSVLAWRVRDKSLRFQEASNLADEAWDLLQNRTLLPQAQARLTRAIELYPTHERAHLYRGLYFVHEGMEAKVEEKSSFVEAAISDLRQAHIAAGGNWPAPNSTKEEATGVGSTSGSVQALAAAARLYFYAGENTKAAEFFRLANDLARVKTRDASSRVPLPPAVYERRTDPLLKSVDSDSPQQAHLPVDTQAELVRGLSASLNSLNPFLATGQAEFVTELIFDTLVNVGPSGNYSLNDSMVGGIDVSEDSSQLTLKLKPNLRWHNGDTLDAADIVFSWHSLDEGHVARIGFTDVKEVDPRTVAFSYVAAAADPLWDLFFPIISRKYFRVLSKQNPGFNADKIQEIYSRDAVGNGPYRLVAPFDPSENEFVLDRWDDYPGTRPHIKRVRFRVIEDQQERIRAVADGKLDVLELKMSEYRWYMNGRSFDPDSIRKVLAESWTYDFVCWNEKRPLFEDRRVRRALTMAVNLRRIIADYHNDMYSECTGTHHPTAWMASRDITPIAYDPNQAAKLLDKAGWRMTVDGTRERNGRRFEFALIVPDLSIETITVLEAIKGYFGAVGVIMNVKPVPWGDYVTKRDARDFDAFVGSVIVSAHPDRVRWRWVTDGIANYGGYSNRTVDQLFEKARQEPDPDNRAEIYREIDRLVYEDQPYTFLWWRPVLAAMNPRLKGVKVGHRGLVGFYPGARDWWFPKETN